MLLASPPNPPIGGEGWLLVAGSSNHCSIHASNLRIKPGKKPIIPAAARKITVNKKCPGGMSGQKIKHKF
jgi:hypothetical protein